MADRKKFLIVGSGGRESAFATRLAEDTELYAIMGHENPTIVECVDRTGGRYAIGDPNDPRSVTEFAIKCGIDYAFVNADDPLANGVVDSLLREGFKAVGGTQKATRIEWDKVYSIEMMQRVCPEFTPMYRIAKSTEEVIAGVGEFRSRGIDIVIKPQGLTGGKGVKVMPEHMQTYEDCIAYASSLLAERPKERVLIVERLEGIEFTIMGITDGVNLILSPASYDYPFRYEGDRGPGTGGMGCFTDREKKLPFMTDEDLEDCRAIMQKIINEINSDGTIFRGILNGGFFKTERGIRFMEFNGRFGDPEGLNILSILDVPFSNLIIKLWEGGLGDGDVAFIGQASVTKYLVAGEYPDPSSQELQFTVNEGAVNELGVEIFFAACVKIGKHEYKTLKKSRVVAFGATAGTINEASEMVNSAIEEHVGGGLLEYRRDIGSAESLDKLCSSAPGTVGGNRHC